MLDPRKVLGVALGVGLACAILSQVQSAARVALRGRLTSECDGALREVAIHYVPDAAPIAGSVFREFLRHLPRDVSVRVLCPDQAAFDDLAARVQPVACRLVAVTTGHAMTCWSQDRWLAVAPPERRCPVTLLSPRGEEGAAAWPARAGDERSADDLAAAAPTEIVAHRSGLFFDGGDFIADKETVFVTPAVLRRNLGVTVRSREELMAALAATFTQRVVLLDEAPDHHAGMFMMLAGNRTAVVGDPSLARRTLEAAGAADRAYCGAVGDDFTPATQALFDAVARQCAAAGYRVVHIPVVPGLDGRTYITHVNGIIDQRGSRRVIYMPAFSHARALNDAAAEVWRSLGYEVRAVDCTSAYTHFGTLHCLVNVVRRG